MVNDNEFVLSNETKVPLATMSGSRFASTHRPKKNFKYQKHGSMQLKTQRQL